MKKGLFLLALASATLASCVSDEVMDVAQNETKKDVKIMFDRPVMYNNVNSRANVYGEIGANQTVRNYPTEEHFRIFAVKYPDTGFTFTAWTPGDSEVGVQNCHFNNAVVKYAGVSIDGWAPLEAEDNPNTTDRDETAYYYWPAGKKLAFAAVSPADLACTGATVSYSDAGLKIENFQVNPNASLQYDLLFSERTVNKTAADMNHGANDYSGIPIRFQHALSSIRFSLMNHTSVDVKLTSIKLWGVKYKGTFTEGIAENSGDRYERTGDTKNVNPAWTLTEDVLAEAYAYKAFEGTLDFPYNAGYVSALNDLDTNPYKATNKCNQLLLLPQPLGTGTNDNKIYLRVDYLVAGQSNYKIVELNPLKTEETTKDANDGAEIGAWAMGSRYTYRIVYNADTAQKDMIYFAPSTTDWVEGRVIIVNL